MSADYGGADYGSRRREHAVGTSQLTELAASGWERRAQCLPAPESEAIDVNAFDAPAQCPGSSCSRPNLRAPSADIDADGLSPLIGFPRHAISVAAN